MVPFLYFPRIFPVGLHTTNIFLSATPIITIVSLEHQMPNQIARQEIWSSTTWSDISTQYEYVFFRVLGDKTEAFEKIQDENIFMISIIQSRPATRA
jgi:hypothetical protein